MILFSRFRLAFAASAMLLASSCNDGAGLAEFRTYASAFERADSASGNILDRLSVAERNQGRLRIQRQNPQLRRVGIDSDFLTANAIYYASSVDPPLTMAYRRAIATVSAYNSTLLAFAQGQGLDALKIEAQRFGTEIGALGAVVGGAPLLAALGPALAALQPAIDEALAAASRAQFREAFIKNYALLDQMLATLSDGTREVYNVLTAEGRRALSEHADGSRPLAEPERRRIVAEADAYREALSEWQLMFAQTRTLMAEVDRAMRAPPSLTRQVASFTDEAARLNVTASAVKAAILRIR